MQVYRKGPDTSRVCHRAFEPSDAQDFLALNSHPDVMRYTGEPPMLSLEQARNAIENYRDFETVGFGRWACFLKQTGKLIGFCGLKYLPEFDEVDIGYRFFPEFWGQGLATETAKASIQFGFNTLKLNQIVGYTLRDNTASARVMLKCGMHLDGEVLYDDEVALRYVINR